MSVRMRFITCCCVAAFTASVSFAFNEPVDTAGPLRVMIHEPAIGLYGAGGLAELSRPDTPYSLTVSLFNQSAEPLRGRLRMVVADNWKIEPPEMNGITLAPGERQRVGFTIRFGKPTYNAHYPIHAYAEFEQSGKRYEAHPVLIVAVTQPDPPRARLPLEWKPVEVSANSQIALWRLPVRRKYSFVSGETLLIEPRQARPFESIEPVAISGGSGSAGTAMEAVVINLGPRAPSMQERVHRAGIEYPLRLPAGSKIALAARTVASGDSTGSPVLRIRVASLGPVESGGEVLQEIRGSQTAAESRIDLSRFAGKAVSLKMEAENSGGGTAAVSWIEPTLVCGTPPEAAGFPPSAQPKPRDLGVITNNGTAYAVRLWQGKRGFLDTTFGLEGNQRKLMFHGFRIRVLNDALEDARSLHQLKEVKDESSLGRYRLRHRFSGWAGDFDLMGEAWIGKGGLHTKFWLENSPPPRPWLHMYLEEILTGPWSEQSTRVYAGPGNVMEDPAAFTMNFDGHSIATSYVGLDFANGTAMVQGIDLTPTRLVIDPESRVYTFNTAHASTITLIPAASVWEGAKLWSEIRDVKASAGVKRLAGRFVYDLWGFQGGYKTARERLERSFRYGLTDAVVVWHTWQRWGYDYRLPDLYPPNPEGGSYEEFRALADACKRHQVMFAPHDNYIDFYPDSDQFTYSNIVFNRDGTPYKAWFNSSRKAQSYRSRPDRLHPFVERNLKLIKQGIDPESYFIDVWSSIAPYDYWSSDGQFFDRAVTRKAWGELFAWIRDYQGNDAPQISEAGHDQLIGWLDGAQAQHLRVDKPPRNNFFWGLDVKDAERVPWFEAVYHDRFILHGAGYEDRYRAGLDQENHGIYSDDYMSVEVMTGRPGMVRDAFHPGAVRKYWLLNDLMRALALKKMEAFSFANGNIHRQQVRWEGGGTVAVNRDRESWQVGGHTLQQHGFWAKVPAKDGAVEVAVERRGNGVVEWASSAGSLYVNARQAGTELRETDFGWVITNGGMRAELRDGRLTLTLLPDSEAGIVRIRWDRLPWKLGVPSRAVAMDENLREVGTEALTAENGEVRLATAKGVFRYRLE